MIVSTLPDRSAAWTRVLLVVLTLAGLLLGVLAMHSMMGSHTDAVSAGSHSHAAASHPDEMTSAAGTSAAMSAGATADSGAALPMLPCDQSCAMGCALMAATCVIVFFLAGLILLARVPALFARVLDAGPRVLRLLPRARFHVYLPSLTVLSISRT
ncbi:hypothetical protein HRK28_19665 [Rathayibacter sp. VKM Ac-2835]|nr:hypothetical protein [Rathayibacter sp. VKM Ac-2835]